MRGKQLACILRAICSCSWRFRGRSNGNLGPPVSAQPVVARQQKAPLPRQRGWGVMALGCSVSCWLGDSAVGGQPGGQVGRALEVQQGNSCGEGCAHGQGFQFPQRRGASSGFEVAKNFLGQDLVDLTVPRNGLGATGLRLVKNVMSPAVAQENATGLLQFSDQISSFQATTSSPILRIPGRSCLENSWYRSSNCAFRSSRSSP